MSMQSLPRIAAAGLAALLLAGCGGSFVPATVAQDGNASRAGALSVRTDLAQPRSITPHPTTIGKASPLPNGGISPDSITPHPTFPKDVDGGATPAPSPRPKALVRTIDSVTAHPAGKSAMQSGAPSPTPSP
jgi:hypothetical protein